MATIMKPALALLVTLSETLGQSFLVEDTSRCDERWINSVADCTSAAMTILGAVPFALAPAPIVVAAGGEHACAVLNDMTVKCWGRNTYGQLGLGYNSDRQSSPQTVPGLSNVVQIALGNYHTCVLLGDRSVKCFGLGDHGELGYGHFNRRNVPQSVSISNVQQITCGAYHSCAVLTDYTAVCWGAAGARSNRQRSKS